LDKADDIEPHYTDASMHMYPGGWKWNMWSAARWTSDIYWNSRM